MWGHGHIGLATADKTSSAKGVKLQCVRRTYRDRTFDVVEGA